MESGTTSLPPVAVVLPYWRFWEPSVPFDLLADRAEILAQVADALGDRLDIRLQEIIASRDEGARVAAMAGALGAEAVLVLQTMAVPPAYTMAALDSMGSLPIILWAVQRHVHVPVDFGHAAITAEGATVGTPMLTNLLVRSGRPFELVVGPVGDQLAMERVILAVRAGVASRRFSRSRIGRVGNPPDGYDCVDADDWALRDETGISLVSIDPGEVRDLFRDVGSSRVESLEQETRARYDIDPDAEGEVLGRSLRLALALEDLVARHNLDAGAMNCHVQEIRFGNEIGITPCFGLGRMTSLGIPWSCAGDVLTAVAMLALKLLGGAANYHELESFDAATGEFVIANSGEHDLAFGDGGRPRLIKNQWFASDPRCGACAYLTAPPGPATLVAFTQLESGPVRHKFIVGAGEFTGRVWPSVGTSNAAFRFLSGPGLEAWIRWCRAGANHHAAATPGDFSGAVEAVARFLGVDALRV